ncbi:hypothetical protein N7457_005425 [Penicillium paradoxum]|uniref:uncharacterized protein n=1 Tax=Penicillium paradoxum TaxID=176176 RepID=UPI002549292E|nr:uncharacterized protein N7457_005425 [Penicillium paradoxum]KAJ5780265.1 hypothetical protein N7457_005425 [Penicillium paradoxum]
MQPHICYDDVAWEKSEEIADTWVDQFFDPSISRPVGNFLLKHHKPDNPVRFDILDKGTFNISLRMTYKTGAAIIRFPLPGATMFPEEKLRSEVAIMRYIHDETPVPVPFVLHCGPKKDSPLELGPFIIMEYIEHNSNMYDLLNIPNCPGKERGRLNPSIDENLLQTLYGELATVLLQLSQPSFSQIGSFSQVDDFTWEVSSRPLSIYANELVRLGSLPQSKLPSQKTTFISASSYFEALAETHIAHLTFQRNDSIESADDCRRKFVGRHLFRKLARERKLTKRWSEFDQGPFKIWCDDFRPANVLVTKDLKIAGVVDWEFTYAAPVEFSYAPPWWLLIERPEYWSKGLEDWTQEFDRRLQTFLKAMIDREDAAMIKEEQRLSGPMRESWESGDFWVMYAARNSFAFDSIYWRKIDQRFFGPVGDVEDAWRQRLDLLSDEQKYEMERLVAQKVKEMESRVLAWDPDEYTLAHIDIAQTTAEKDAEKVEGVEEEVQKEDLTSDEGKMDGAHDLEAKANASDVQQISEKLANLPAELS